MPVQPTTAGALQCSTGTATPAAAGKRRPCLRDRSLCSLSIAVRLMPEAHVEQGIERIVPLHVAAGSLQGGCALQREA